MRKHQPTIRAKLLVLLFAILLPLVIVQTYMFAWGQNAIFGEVSSAAASNVVYLRETFISDLQGIQTQFLYLLNNFDISNFFVMHDYMPASEYYMKARDIRDLLLLMSNIEPMLSEIRLHYVSKNITISSLNGMKPLSSSDAQLLLHAYRTQHSMLLHEGNMWSVAHVYPEIAVARDSQPVYYVQGILSINQIIRHLSSFSKYSNKNAILINHNTDGMLSSAVDLNLNVQTIKDIIIPQTDEEVYSFSDRINGVEYYIVGCYSRLINCSFVQIIPQSALRGTADRFLLFIIILSVLVVFVLIGFAHVVSKHVRRPVNDLVQGFYKAGQGDFSVKIDGKYSWEYNELANGFNAMTQQIDELIEDNYEQTIRLQSAELKQLQAQINPHFLYNSFFFLRNAIDSHEADQASLFAGYLGKYFSFITKQQDILPLSVEYEHALTYLNIQLLRFEGFISAQIQPLTDKLKAVPVPRLILQPIFENIMHHGFSKNMESETVAMSFDESDEYISIRIEDSGGDLSDERIAAMNASLLENTPLNITSGLCNIHMRLKRFMGAACGLSFTRSSYGGLCVEVRIKEVK
ncbi:hypothetical protein AGMMS49992_24390 [Clostridia bacterium]|nr:hypothetical protein AGMMS49992_24390 [Clostridia bacterium]